MFLSKWTLQGKCVKETHQDQKNASINSRHKQVHGKPRTINYLPPKSNSFRSDVLSDNPDLKQVMDKEASLPQKIFDEIGLVIRPSYWGIERKNWTFHR